MHVSLKPGPIGQLLDYLINPLPRQVRDLRLGEVASFAIRKQVAIPLHIPVLSIEQDSCHQPFLDEYHPFYITLAKDSYAISTHICEPYLIASLTLAPVSHNSLRYSRSRSLSAVSMNWWASSEVR